MPNISTNPNLIYVQVDSDDTAGMQRLMRLANTMSRRSDVKVEASTYRGTASEPFGTFIVTRWTLEYPVSGYAWREVCIFASSDGRVHGQYTSNFKTGE